MAAAAIEITGLVKRFGTTEVLHGIDLAVDDGTMLVLLGPSGCGKTTLLRLIAGLERPDAGRIRIGDRLVAGPDAWVAPERRRVGLVFQDWALFPHLSVRANVAFGLPRAQRRRGGGGGRVDEVLDMVDLTDLADRLPGTLSGGQQQRVALARALAPAPDVLLLDEPFSNLDATLRVQVRRDVRAVLRDVSVTAVFVTHDQEEAFYLGDEVAVLSDGHAVQQGSPAELYTRPATPWVASFVGEANLVPGRAAGGRASTALGEIAVGTDLHGPVQVLLRPEHLRLRAGGDGRLVEIEYYGHDCAYRVELQGVSLRVRADAPPRFAEGDAVAVHLDIERAVAWPWAANAETDADPRPVRPCC